MSHADPSISWPQVSKFIGQLNHDLRNHLNAIELQSAFLEEIAEEGEVKEEVKRLRGMTGEISAHLQRLSALLAKVELQPMRYTATDFVEDLQAKVAAQHPAEAEAIEWEISLGEEALEIDPQLLLEAFAELFANAFAHGRGEGAVIFSARAEGPSLVFALREPKKEAPAGMENWGELPLARLRHGHYALGLFRARTIFESHHGTMLAKFDPATSQLTTTVTLPCARA